MGICVSGVLFSVSGVVLGQTASEPSYEVSMHLLMGSNDSGSKSDLPSSLNAVSQQLKSKVGYSSFRLAGTIIGRMVNQGSFEYKSTSNLFGQNPTFRSFLEITIRDLRPGNSAGVLKFDALRFGARVPMINGYKKDESGRDQPIVQYEQIGLTSSKLVISESVPTLVGTLDVPNGTEMIFILMTVKPLDR